MKNKFEIYYQKLATLVPQKINYFICIFFFLLYSVVTKGDPPKPPPKSERDEDDIEA